LAVGAGLKDESGRLKAENWKPSAISTAVRKRVKRVMWERVGILRDEISLSRAIAEFEQIERSNLSTSSRNFVTLALLVARAALWREESRGGHFRSDFPEQREDWRIHSVQKLGDAIGSAETIDFAPDSADAAW
jgi:L-aspartate oxidase